jgi:hypothetical protein
MSRRFLSMYTTFLKGGIFKDEIYFLSILKFIIVSK